ncbi:MAG: kelch repeat-containing protein [Gemmatimonadaceae bacterium]
MSVARAAHSATLLSDGRVLIVGGLEGAAGSAELFDPTTRTFSRTGSPRVPRGAHTATLLPDGRVLIAGGYNGSYLASTEIFDPAHGTFTPGPNMIESRIDHLAITLGDGRTLIVGGQGGESTFLASAELYDPTISRFIPTGSMAVPRASHVAALLPDGTVIVVGGHSGRHQQIQLYASAERYHPTLGVFTPAGSMTRRRHKHSGVVLPSGQLLITGGADERDDQGQYRDAELYDAERASFQRVGEMQRSRYKHAGAMTVLGNGTVLIAGGAAEAEVFDPRGGSFALVPTSPQLAGSFSTVTLLRDGSVLITGGYGNGSGARANAWIYAPGTP